MTYFSILTHSRRTLITNQKTHSDSSGRLAIEALREKLYKQFILFFVGKNWSK